MPMPKLYDDTRVRLELHKAFEDGIKGIWKLHQPDMPLPGPPAQADAVQSEHQSFSGKAQSSCRLAEFNPSATEII